MFRSLDFFEFAKELRGSTFTYQEASQRTMISRLYYACFLAIRDQIKQQVQNTSVKSLYDSLYTDPYIHGVVMDVANIADRHARNLLRKLRDKRNNADYKPRMRNLSSETDNAFRMAETLVTQRIPNIPNKIVQHLNRIQDKIEEWHIRQAKRIRGIP